MRKVSAAIKRQYYGIPGWLWLITGVGAVVVIGWLLYQYFIYPGDIILAHYKKIIEDMYAETKTFLIENEKKGIYGLTAGQEKIIEAKEEAAERLRPTVERILTERQVMVWSWVETAIIGIIVALAAPGVIKALKGLVAAWRKENPEASTNITSHFGHAHLIFELVLNEFAYLGRTDIAGGFVTNIQTMYSTYTEPGLTAGINYYHALLPTLPPDTMAWYVANQMLTYMTYEISLTTGIMGTLWSWWYPPMLPPI